MQKTISIAAVMAALFLGLFFVEAGYAQHEIQEKKVYFSFHHGNLAGTGVGASYRLSGRYWVEFSLGGPPLLGWGQTFAGNRGNMLLGLNISSGSGWYLAPGIHTGYYRMTAFDKHNLRRVRHKETVWLVSPRLALGFDYVGPDKARLFSLELGVSALIPEQITRDVQRGQATWIFEAERSWRGRLFPSYTFRMKI